MDRWLARYEGRVQVTEIFVNNAYGVEWRWLNWLSTDDVPGDYCKIQGRWYRIYILGVRYKVRLDYTNCLVFYTNCLVFQKAE